MCITQCCFLFSSIIQLALRKRGRERERDDYLKTYAANFIVHISCVGIQEKLSGSCLLTICDFGSIQFSETLMSDGYCNIFLTK